MKNRHTHAIRNKELSGELLSGKKYFDWAVTTAFYSAIHFVENEILPCEVNGKPCANIDDVKRAYHMPGRHASRERLVMEKLNASIGAKYKWLDDKSRYARYTTYKVTISEAEKANQFLNDIAAICKSS
jgi:hypothetical protein